MGFYLLRILSEKSAFCTPVTRTNRCPTQGISLLLLWCMLGPEVGNLDPDHRDKWQAHNRKPEVKENGAYKNNSGQAKTAPG